MSEHIQKTIQAYYTIFTGPSGELVLEDLEAAFGGENFEPGVTRCCDLAYREGQRSVILRIEAMIEHVQSARVPEDQFWGSSEDPTDG